MADETIRRLFDALDILRQQNARIETLLSEREKLCDVKLKPVERLAERLDARVTLLEKSRSIFSGGLGFAVWAISTLIVIWGVVYK